jgi:hypothetical protein
VGVASSKYRNTRKLCLLLESLAHLGQKYRKCWTWTEVTCIYHILLDWLLPVFPNVQTGMYVHRLKVNQIERPDS